MVGKSGNRNTDENNVMIDDSQGNVAKNVVINSGEPFGVTGEFSLSGLHTAFRNTTMNISTTAIPLPAMPLADRNSMEIHNLSSTETLYIGNSDVTADRSIGTTSGKEIPPNSFWSIDITEAIVLYGVYASGTDQVKIMEVA